MWFFETEELTKGSVSDIMNSDEIKLPVVSTGAGFFCWTTCKHTLIMFTCDFWKKHITSYAQRKLTIEVKYLWSRGESTSFVFRLIVRLKSWKALLKQVIRYWRYSAELEIIAASSGKRKSQRHLSWTLVWALCLKRLKAGPASEVDSFGCWNRCMFQHHSKEDPKQSRSQNTTLFYSIP